ncbi:unnamed protein product [Ectocarpus sp. CCAP 1310/34]|nr:unnamed protein product [Ectocarpus sp. CCAP 1310/34]
MPRLHRQASLAGALAALVGSPTLLHGGVRAEKDTVGEGFSIASGGQIETLNRATYISSILESNSPALVWLYAGADCPNCETVLPAVEEAADKLSSWGVSVAAIDLSKEAKLRRDLSIPKGLPMMFKVHHSESTPNPYGGLPVRPEEVLTMFQDARSLQKKVLSAIPDSVVSIDLEKSSSGPSSSLKEALAEGDDEEAFAAILFTEAGKASPVLRVLASQVRGKVSTVQARLAKGSATPDDEDDEDVAKDEVLARMLKGIVDIPGTIPSVPFLVLLNKESGEASVYRGAVDDAKAMLAFVREGAGISAAETGGAGASASGSDGSGDRKGAMGGVLELDPELLSVLEEKGTEALVAAFVEGGDVDSIPGWVEATKGLQGEIRAGVLDCTAYPAQCEGSAKQKAPFLKVYPHGKGVDGDKRGFPSVLPATEVKEAVAEAEASLPEVVTVIPAGVGTQRIQDVVQSFVGANIVSGESPMCLFVLSKKEEPTAVIKTVAAAFQSAKVRVMFIAKPDQDLLAALGVYKLPAMMLMFPQQEGMNVAALNPDQPQPAEGEQAMVTAHYSPAHWGPVTHDHVSEFIMSHLSSLDTSAFLLHAREMSATAKLNRERLPVQLERFLNEFGDSEEAGSTSSSGSGDGASAANFQGVPEVTPELWASVTGEGAGGGSPRTLGVFFLDRFSERFASDLRAAEEAAQKATARLGGSGIAFVWADAPCQEGFARALGVSDASEVPVLVAFSSKHQKSTRFVGAWEADSLGTFLGRALGGRVPLFPVDGEAPRPDESLDCAQRPPPAWLAGGGEGTGDAAEEDDGMGDFMAEILAEEAKAKQELEEEVARSLQEMEDAKGAEEKAPKRKKKIAKKRKKKSGARSEL